MCIVVEKGLITTCTTVGTSVVHLFHTSVALLAPFGVLVISAEAPSQGPAAEPHLLAGWPHLLYTTPSSTITIPEFYRREQDSN